MHQSSRNLAEATGMLSGLRVLDLTTGGTLLCGRLLADLGADVIVVEPPGGNPARYRAPFWHDQPGPETSLFWLAYSCNKRGVTLDLQHELGRESLHRLLGTTDIILESFYPGYLAGLGLGYEDLAQHYPRLIYTSITPFGQTGPRRHYRATDLITMALGGSACLIGEPDREPLRIGFPQSELHAGVEATVATLLALQHRRHAGAGQHIDVAAQSCIIWTLMNATHFAALGQATRQRFGVYRESLPGKRQMIFPCKDGFVSVVFFGGPFGAKGCHTLVRWMAEWGMAPDHMLETDWDTWDDVYLATLGHEAQAEIDRVEHALADFFSPFTMQELYEQALQRRLMLAPVAHAQTIIDDPQLAAREFFVPLKHATLGETLPLSGPFAKCSTTPLHLRRCAPQLGEHNQEILGAELGLSAEGDTVAASPVAWPRPPLPQSDEPLQAWSPQPNRDQQPMRQVRVLDLSWYATGPIATKYLADHGAEVIKIESASRPDGLRQAPPWQGPYEDLNTSQFLPITTRVNAVCP